MLNIVDKEKPDGVIVQFGGQTPLNLALRLEARRRADHRHQRRQHRHRRGPRAVPAAAARAGPEAAAQRHRAHRRGRRWRWRRRSAIRWSCARATCSAAARWRSSTTTRTCERYMREAVHVSRRIAGADRPLPRRRHRGRRRLHQPTATGRDDRRHHGAHRGGRHPLRRLGLLAPAVHAVGRRCRTRCARQTARDGRRR